MTHGHGAWVWVLVLLPFAQQPTTQPASQPSSSTTQRTTYRRPQSLDIVQTLLRERQSRRPILPDTSQQQKSGGGAAAKEHEGREPLLLEGTMLIQKSGRLLRQGQTSFFEFDALDVPNAPTTMEIEKNAFLEQMENAADGGAKSFVVTAEVTRYRGRNYLVLKQVTTRVDHGNIKP